MNDWKHFTLNAFKDLYTMNDGVILKLNVNVKCWTEMECFKWNALMILMMK